jgi:hypothetical protein
MIGLSTRPNSFESAMRVAVPDQVRTVFRRLRARHGRIGTRQKRPPGAAQDHHRNVVVGLHRMQSVSQRVHQIGIDRVQLRGPVQGEEAYRTIGFDQRHVFGHDRFLLRRRSARRESS